jgi:hypothetical protein
MHKANSLNFFKFYKIEFYGRKIKEIEIFISFNFVQKSNSNLLKILIKRIFFQRNFPIMIFHWEFFANLINSQNCLFLVNDSVF